MKIGFGPLLIAALVAGLIGGIAFGGGVLYGRITAPQPVQAQTASSSATRAGTTTANNAAAAGTPSVGRGRGAGGGSFPGGAGGNALQGAIASVNGSTLTIRTAQGVEQQVQITPQTQISMLQPAGLADLIPGTVILAQGQANDNGPFVAGSITITAASPNAARPSGTPGPRPARSAQPTPTP